MGSGVISRLKQSVSGISIIGRLAADTRGNTTLIAAASIFPLVAAIGGAIDLSRAYTVKAQLQAAVDSAALAGARSFQMTGADGGQTVISADQNKMIKSYFDGNFPEGYLGVINRTYTATPGRRNDRPNVVYLEVNGTADVPVTFMSLFGMDSIAVTAQATAETGSSDDQLNTIEAMLVLDNTGSMATRTSTGTRISDLQRAAREFVDIVHQGKNVRNEIALGFVPYNTTVNVGRLLPNNAIDHLVGFSDNDPSRPANLNWKGCIENDATRQNLDSDGTFLDPGAWDITRTLPGEGGNPRVRPFLYPPIYVARNGNSDQSRAAHYEPNTSRDYRRYNNLYILTGAQANSPAYRNFFYSHYIKLNTGSNNHTSEDVIIDSKTGGYFDPRDGINDPDWRVEIGRLPSGITDNDSAAAAYGINGGWNDPAVPGSFDPASPNYQCVSQAMPIGYGRDKQRYFDYIDDKNEAHDPGHGTLHHIGLLWGYRLLVRNDAFPRTPPANRVPQRVLIFMTDGNMEMNDPSPQNDRVYSAYGTINDRRLTTATGENQFKDAVSARFEKVCTAAKNEGVALYVIAFAINNDAEGRRSRDMFERCAPGKFIEAASGPELTAAFREIALDIIDLRLSR